MSNPPIVILESPYSGQIPRNVAYAQRAMNDARERGEVVIMPHLLWTQHHLAPNHFVCDWDQKYEVKNGGREVSLRQIHKLRKIADKVIFYMDYGLSSGMKDGFDQCKKEGIPYEERFILEKEMDTQIARVRTCTGLDKSGRTLEEVIQDRK